MAYIYRYEHGQFTQFEKPVVREQPVTIVVNGTELATFLCTPEKLDYMTVGFLAFEGLIDGPEELRELDVDAEQGVVDVVITKPLVKPTKRVFTSGCGTGLTFTLRLARYTPCTDDLRLAPEQIFPLMQQLFAGATMYNTSRGIHAVALSDSQGVLLLAEDVGRHNALDKVLGEALLKGLPTAGRLVLSSGRISSEMLRKGAYMGVSCIISRTSPTTLSIEAAKRIGITLIGYVRRQSFNVYTHPERILYQHPTPVTTVETVVSR